MNQIDARGFSCPELGKPLTVLVDSPTPLQNITRFARNAGHKVDSRPLGDDFELVIS